jgi:hypothetical protein
MTERVHWINRLLEGATADSYGDLAIIVFVVLVWIGIVLIAFWPA